MIIEQLNINQPDICFIPHGSTSPEIPPTSLPHGAMADVVDFGSPSLRWEPSAPDDAGGSWRLEDDVGGRKVLTVRPAPQRDFWSSWDPWEVGRSTRRCSPKWMEKEDEKDMNNSILMDLKMGESTIPRAKF